MRFKANSSAMVMFLLTMVLNIVMAGCVDSDCTLENSVRLRCQLRSSQDGGATEARLSDTLTVRTVHPDTVLLNRAIGLASFTLPMSFTLEADTLLLCLSCRNGAHTVDTLVVGHTNIPHFESLDCATAIFHDITSVDFRADAQTTEATTRIDSVNAANIRVDYDQKNHLNIYLGLR